MVKDADYPLVLKLLDDSRVQLASSAWAAVKYAANPPGDYFERIANAAFRRLREVDPKNMGQQASYLGSLMKALPKPEILKHRSDLEWLARQDHLRTLANPALVRLWTSAPTPRQPCYFSSTMRNGSETGEATTGSIPICKV